MITSHEKATSPLLAPFVRCYRQRCFDTHGQFIVNPWVASHETTLIFHFKDWPVSYINPCTGQSLQKGNYGGVVGAGTQFNGEILLRGNYMFLEIVFRPNGVLKIFGVPPQLINNYILFTQDVFSRNALFFYEQLSACNDLSARAVIADAWLAHHLTQRKRLSGVDAITVAGNRILHHSGLVNLDQMAREVNMSIRNFERRFTEQVGMPAKLFCCVTRFNHALTEKLQQPSKSWLSIAHKYGYFDQMHLI